MGGRYAEAFPVQEGDLGGLTKLEYAAIHILAGLAGADMSDPWDQGHDKLSDRATWAVAQAKALFDELP